MGVIQGSINNMLGTAAAAVAVGKGLQGQQAIAKGQNTLIKQQQALMQPDHGKAMTNAIAEEKALSSLYDATYGGRKRAWKKDAVLSAEEKVLREAKQTAHERVIETAAEYNKPAGKPFTRTLSGGND